MAQLLLMSIVLLVSFSVYSHSAPLPIIVNESLGADNSTEEDTSGSGLDIEPPTEEEVVVPTTTTTPTSVTDVESLTVRLLSEEAGAYVGVTPSGDVYAKSRKSDPSTVFYISYPDQGIARFESAHYRGTYLMIDTDPVTQLRTLRCGVPSGNNDQFEVLQIFGLTPAVLHQGEDCFIAFDSNGEPFGPCGLATTNYEVQISVL